MKYVDEFRNDQSVATLVRAIGRTATRAWTLMEVCGGQTHTIVKHGLDRLLPETIEMLHGPGCPVCVTPIAMVDRAHAIAAQPGVIFCSFGDMLRVPGSTGDLLSRKARGADIRIVYSPLDAVALAEKHPDRDVVFFAIGFETTAPANAMAVHLAHKKKLANFSMLVSHVAVPPVVEALLKAPDNRVQGLLGPGHVCTVMGASEYDKLARDHKIPIVITGFEPVDILHGILLLVAQLESGVAKVENQYTRIVPQDGNPSARALIEEIFVPCDREWRGLGSIATSGLALRDRYAQYDADRRFPKTVAAPACDPEACISGQVLRGVKKPKDCAAFGRECTPESPLGATMVSSEGACAAYYAYTRHLVEA